MGEKIVSAINPRGMCYLYASHHTVQQSFFFFFLISSGGWAKISLKLTKVSTADNITTQTTESNDIKPTAFTTVRVYPPLNETT